jgi:F-type H+-transporting ATPase subunit epsilon
MSQLSFEIVTPSGLVFQEEVWEVLLPTPEGQIGILPHHAPLVTLLTPGIITIKRSREEAEANVEHVATAGGFVAIDGGRVRVLADEAERADDIDEAKAKEALERAEALKRNNQSEVSLADATAAIELNLARLKVASLRRRRRAR